ncbi:hypothetical protein FA15DRAFT_667126 [Coprinopsis marcescibilis]|uniref:Uncharacterized protein n=1 Tax=Coprinopsis marcescibilis TaxID=230819 RepID=A0A5C3L132_COPMA|nr:hypothetical protein FA15DRAFT_667126 [Coprinopsis marcescibilis]
MKIPTSSSILLATLAISSSSTSLAAPTPNGDGSNDGSMTVSQSNSHIRTVYMESDDGGDTRMAERAMEDGKLKPRTGVNVIDVLVGLPLVGPMAKALLLKEMKDCPPPDGPSSQSFEEVSPDELARLQGVVDTVSSALSGVLPISAPVPVPTGIVGGVASMAPATPIQSAIAGVADSEGDDNSGNQPSQSASASGDIPAPSGEAGAASENDPSQGDSSFLISPTTTVADAEQADATMDPSDAPSPTATPTVPAGPPNTPAMPENPEGPDQDQEAK